MTSRFKMTIRGEGTELRGYATVEAMAALTAPPGEQPYMVVASPAEDDFSPFSPTIEQSMALIAQFVEDNKFISLPDLLESLAELHAMQARVIQGERALRETAEAELRDRELHHFETEQENAALRMQIEYCSGSCKLPEDTQ